MYTESEISTSLPLPLGYRIRRSDNYALHNFDFECLIDDMKHDRKWKNGEMNMMILMRSPVKKVLLVILHGKSEIISQQIDDSTDFKILEGRLELHFLKESITLIHGEMLKLSEKTSYRIKAIEETAILMILKTKNQYN